MTTWVFQSNPKTFNVDRYVTENDILHWSLNQSNAVKKVRAGDTVYILRADGGKKNSGRIIARCVVLESPIPYAEEIDYEEEDKGYWLKTNHNHTKKNPFAKLEILERDTFSWVTREKLKTDLLLNESHFVKAPRQTNYELNELEAEQLDTLWLVL